MSEDFRVLIVDDDFHVAKLHAAYVDSVAGFLALPPAGSASQALQAIHSLRPDLVLLDVYLPDASGLDLLHQLDVDTVILSAASDTASLRLAFRRGALGYLLKPFTAESLSQQLRSYARYRRILAQPGSVNQETVERAKRALIPGDVVASARPRSATEAAVLESLVPGEQYSAADVAARVGVSRATAQRYLSALADDGAVDIQLRYGTTGRPEHRYGIPAPAGPLSNAGSLGHGGRTGRSDPACLGAVGLLLCRRLLRLHGPVDVAVDHVRPDALDHAVALQDRPNRGLQPGQAQVDVRLAGEDHDVRHLCRPLGVDEVDPAAVEHDPGEPRRRLDDLAQAVLQCVGGGEEEAAVEPDHGNAGNDLVAGVLIGFAEDLGARFAAEGRASPDGWPPGRARRARGRSR